MNSNGKLATRHNAIEDDLQSEYDLVFADAVLLHFTREETKIVANKVFNSLSPIGRFALTLKEGEGDEWSDTKLSAARYFCYWGSKSIYEVLTETGFTTVETQVSDSTRENQPKWLHIVASK